MEKKELDKARICDILRECREQRKKESRCDMRFERGVCECVCEPRGRNGLEGYQRGDKYLYKKKLSAEGREVNQVYVDGEYYETCGKGLFKRYFKVVEIV